MTTKLQIHLLEEKKIADLCPPKEKLKSLYIIDYISIAPHSEGRISKRLIMSV